MPVPPLGHVPAQTPVAVVFGGPSAEHDVSIVSGTAIAEALSGSGYPAELWYIELDGAWWRLPDGHRREGRPQAVYDDPAALGADGPLGAAEALDLLADRDVPPLAFIALHGPFGEDGTVQALCEAAGLVYTGSGVTASAIGMDKAVFKRLARGLGLPVTDWLEVRASRWAADPESVLAELDAFATAGGDARLMVKPARLGSSLGMTLAHGAGERSAALVEAFRFDDLVLAERYLAGARDLEVAVIGNEPDALEVYGPGEIMSGHEFYDYQAKYTPGLSESSLTAEVTVDERARLLDLARATYAALGCEGFARVDFLLAERQLIVSEINTIPGFTPISLFPALPASAGYDFAAVCSRVVDLALAREASRIRHRPTTADLPR
ncbi:MAG: D-alanine--D-alanine ligase family protein [Candidatus Limnocylindrales bacterium]